jgi:cobalt-precorrin-5B (C1)-methyltransferase
VTEPDGRPAGPDEEEGLPPPPRRRGLRTGFTTGACAAAAAKAATRALLTQSPQAEVTLDLVEAGVRPTFRVARCAFGPGWATCSVVKDAGDDPDVTHGAEICATVRWRGDPGIRLAGGAGVGTVTRPGLGLPVGEPAINPVPRAQILRAVEEEAGGALAQRGLHVEIWVPRGEELARRTLNPRLGIVGGISILGTTGIVHPYSTAAYRASVLQGIDVAAANGCRHVVLSTGGKSEAFARELFPALPEMAFVEMGEFTGAALDRCRQAGVGRVTLAGMIGKLSKIAQGHFQTHVAGNRVDTRFLAALAAEEGAPPPVQAEILAANTARHVQEIALARGVGGLFRRICQRVCERAAARVQGALEVEAVMFDFEGRVLGRAGGGPRD